MQVLVNGRQPEQCDFRRSEIPGMFRQGVLNFNETIRVALQQDAQLIVAAIGEGVTIGRGWGLNPCGRMLAVACTNPIFVDAFRDGFEANGDTLGHPLVPSPRSGRSSH